jgi:hypothetical protein
VIRRIGIICQDANSLGFLLGLQQRLECVADWIEPETVVGKSTTMPRAHARNAALYFQKKGVDLIVRFTDADAAPWQQVQRHELASFPDDIRPIVVCGVAVNNTEQWLALNPVHITETLNINKVDFASASPDDRTGLIKKAILRRRTSLQPAHHVVEGLVAGAPADVFRSWLKADASLRRFYQDCRAKAAEHRCEVPNELDAIQQRSARKNSRRAKNR